MKRIITGVIAPIFDLAEPMHERTFSEWQREEDAEAWRGRGAVHELPELPQLGGAGGNADGQGDPIDTYHERHRGSLLVGPASSVGEKGNASK